MNMKYHYKVNNLCELEKLYLLVNFYHNKNKSIIKQYIHNLLHLIKRTRYSIRKYERNGSLINKDFISFFYNRDAIHNNRYNNYPTIKSNKNILSQSPIHQYRKVEYHNYISSFYRLKHQRNIEYNDVQNSVKLYIIPSTILHTISQFVKDCDIYEIEIDIYMIDPNDNIYKDNIEQYFSVDSFYIH